MQRIVIIGGTVVAGLGLIAIWALLSQSGAPDIGSLTHIDDSNEVARHVEMVRLGILTSENFLGHQIREIEGTIRNISDRTLWSVQLELAFGAFDGSVAFTSTEEVLRTALPPGEDRRYTLRFENLPANWNYRVPVVRAVRVAY